MNNKTYLVHGIIVKIDDDRVLINLCGLDEEDEDCEQWIPMPYNIPSQLLNGCPFWGELPEEINTFSSLRDNLDSFLSYSWTPFELSDAKLKEKLNE